MKNKSLILIIIFLIPIVIISFCKKETYFYNEEKKIQIKLSYQKQYLILDLEEYILGVVAAEMPASFNNEALKSQAIVARTFAINKLYINNKYVFDTNDQAYISIEKMKSKWGKDFEKYYFKIKNIVLETKDQIVTYNNIPIKAYYFAISNGKTENSQSVFKEKLPYLESTDSLFEKDLINFTKTLTISKKDFCNTLNIINCNLNIQNIIRNETNRITSIEINSKIYTGIKIRKIFNLRSTDFTINIKGNEITFTTYGYGHGVGLSQYGAQELAKKGYNYEKIIKYYYKNVEITSIKS